MLNTWWAKTIFWLLLLAVIPATWRALSSQTQQAKEAALTNTSYQSCMDMANNEYAAAIASKDIKKIALFSEKYGVEKVSQNINWSIVVNYADEHCRYISRNRTTPYKP